MFKTEESSNHVVKEEEVQIFLEKVADDKLHADHISVQPKPVENNHMVLKPNDDSKQVEISKEDSNPVIKVLDDEPKLTEKVSVDSKQVEKKTEDPEPVEKVSDDPKQADLVSVQTASINETNLFKVKFEEDSKKISEKNELVSRPLENINPIPASEISLDTKSVEIRIDYPTPSSIADLTFHLPKPKEELLSPPLQLHCSNPVPQGILFNQYNL